MIHRFVVEADAIRPYVHSAFEIYEGTDAAPLDGSRLTETSVSLYRCSAGELHPKAAGVGVLFARVAPPDGPEGGPLPYVVRMYASAEAIASVLASAGVPGGLAQIEVGPTEIPRNWIARMDTGSDGQFFAASSDDPSDASSADGSGPFLAITADESRVVWITSDVAVTARTAACVAEPRGGVLEAFVGGTEKPCAEAAVVDPLDFPMLFHVLPWDGTDVPPPPATAPSVQQSGERP